MSGLISVCELLVPAVLLIHASSIYTALLLLYIAPTCSRPLYASLRNGFQNFIIVSVFQIWKFQCQQTDMCEQKTIY